MPRPPAPGRKWVSVELAEHDYNMLRYAAKKDRRSLNVFLQIELGELAAKIDLDTLAERAAMQEQTKVQEHPAQPIGAGTTQAPDSGEGIS
jgi:hypothetical protein